MRNVNTMLSYSLRIVVALHASLLGILFVFEKSTGPATNLVLILTIALVFIILALLVADWATRKEQTRRFSKLIDSIVGVGWVLAIIVAVLHSLSMGTL
jgi:hypothetical protein